MRVQLLSEIGGVETGMDLKKYFYFALNIVVK